MPALYTHTSRLTGTILTASIYNADHQNHIDNGIPSALDDYSANLAQMQTVTDPGELGSESLSTSLSGELERLRFAMLETKQKIDASLTRWYQTPGGTILSSAIIDAKGDLLTGTSDNVLVRKAVGADGTILMPLSGATDGLMYQDGILNGVAIRGGKLTVSMAASACTVAVKTVAGNDPSASDPVYIAFRSVTATDGTPILRKVTAALNLTIPSTALVGTENTVQSRIYVGALDNSGAVELYVINTYSPLSPGAHIYLPAETDLISTTTLDTAADATQIPYSTVARTGLAHRVLGYFESTQATAGAWVTSASKIQNMGPGVKRTGDTIQTRFSPRTSVATGSSIIPYDDTIPTSTEGTELLNGTIVPTNATNLLVIDTLGLYSTDTSIGVTVSLFQDSGSAAIAATASNLSTASTICPIHLKHTIQAGTTASTTIRTRVGPAGAAVLTINGVGGVRRFGGVCMSYVSLTEVMV